MIVIVLFSYLVCQKVESLKLHHIRTSDFIVLSQSCYVEPSYRLLKKYLHKCICSGCCRIDFTVMQCLEYMERDLMYIGVFWQHAVLPYMRNYTRDQRNGKLSPSKTSKYDHHGSLAENVNVITVLPYHVAAQYTLLFLIFLSLHHIQKCTAIVKYLTSSKQPSKQPLFTHWVDNHFSDL